MISACFRRFKKVLRANCNSIYSSAPAYERAKVSANNYDARGIPVFPILSAGKLSGIVRIKGPGTEYDTVLPGNYRTIVSSTPSNFI